MNRPYLIMSGEPAVAIMLAFSNPKWDCVSTPTKLVSSEYIPSRLRRENRPREILNGVIHYADVSDKEIEKHNLQTIIDYKIPCWPNPNLMLKMMDRHEVMKECVDSGFVDHEVQQCTYEEFKYLIHKFSYPFVIKMGTEHRGIGKELILNGHDIPLDWDGIATIEPYFEGDSVRVLIVGQNVFSFKTTNPDSWIKNSPGADIEKCSVPDDMVKHARKITDYFGLDISGVDYIVEPDGTYHFLEINQYPGLGVFEDIEECGKTFIKEKMYDVEMANS